MTQRVLVVNAGSSSVKLRLLDGDDVVASADLDATSDRFDPAAIATAITPWPQPDAVGHRIVHGGTRFTGPVPIDASVRASIGELADLAPLHQRRCLEALDATTAVIPGGPAVACFDTAFHATIPDEASTYAVPQEWRGRYGVRRYGFHGLSHASCARRAAVLVGAPLDALRIVSCHLGSGASLAAIAGGRSVDTTMGFTPLDGLVMATRSGSVDPGLVLWLQEHVGLSAHDVADALEHHSGMTALAGTGDQRQIEAAALRGEPGAVLALDVYVHRLVACVAAMAAAMDGMEVLAFTGGVGENSELVRRRACARLAFLGVAVADSDPAVPDGGDREIGPEFAAVRTVVINAREDLEIAHEVRSILSGARPS